MEESGRVCYHVWFATKNRKLLLQGEIEEKVKELLPAVASEKRIELLACETMFDHVHLLLRTSPQELPRAMFFLKGISSRRVFQEFPELKLDAHTVNFWQARYAAKKVPNGATRSLKRYILTQKDRPEKYDPPYR